MKNLGRPFPRGEGIRLLVLPDVHYPVHDWKALDLVHQAAADIEVNAVVQLGDYLDMGALGRWVAGKPRATENDRLRDDARLGAEGWRKLLDILRKRNPDCRAFMLEGNHEERLHRWLDENPYMEGLISVPELLELKDTATAWVPCDSEQKILRFDWTNKGIVPRSYSMTDWADGQGFAFTHGWFTGIHNAKKHVERYGRGPIVYGHTHTVQEYTSHVFGHPRPFAASIGHLSLRGSYLKTPDAWQLAFGVVTMGAEVGQWDLAVTRIHKGKRGAYHCVVDGRSYSREAA